MSNPPEKPPAPRPPRSMRVLVVEDNMVNQKLAKVLLEKRGHRPSVADSGEAALDLMRGQSFDVVLMDVQMPGLDGYQTTGHIRLMERENGGHTPIVAMTAHAMQGDRERCLKAGMDHYVSKPFKPEELYDAVERFAGSQNDQVSSEPMVDRKTLMGKFGDDPAMLTAMVEIFAQESPKQLEQVRQALADGTGADLRIAAHTLKGSVSIFTQSEIFDLCYGLENMGKNNEMQDAPASLAKLAPLLERLNRELKDLL